MKFVNVIVFMSLMASFSAHANTGSGDIPCPKLAAGNPDRARPRQDDIKEANMTFGTTQSAPTKVTPKQNGTATKGS